MRIQLFANENKKSQLIKMVLVEKLLLAGFEISDNPEMAIAIGGDGTFIKMVKACLYDSEIIYTGINCGTLGFLQNINPDELDLFVDILKKEKYKLEKISLQETLVETDTKKHCLLSINEVVIRNQSLDTAFFQLKIDNVFVENYVGDGLLVATSLGTTAYNLSFGGSVVYSSFHAMQITPIAPLNSNSYRNIISPIVIPEAMLVELRPIKFSKDLIFSVDGENKHINDVKKISIKCRNKKLKFLRLNEYHYFKTIHDKFVS